jgi:hypothetical protein
VFQAATIGPGFRTQKDVTQIHILLASRIRRRYIWGSLDQTKADLHNRCFNSGFCFSGASDRLLPPFLQKATDYEIGELDLERSSVSVADHEEN